MRLDESFLNDLARDNLTDQATQMAAGTEPPGATPMTMGEFATSVADVPAGLLKGAVQGTVGLPGDIESLTYGVRELFNRRADEGALDAFLRGLEQKTILPTTENVKKWLDENVGTLVPAGASERRTEAAKIPEFVGELGGAGKTVIEASKAAGRGLGQVAGASADMAARTPAMQAGSVKPSAFMPSQAAPAAEPQRSDIGFYSAVEKAVLDSKQEKGTGAQFLAQITKTQGVKPEELKWTGLDEFLKGKKSVTKQEIQDYLQANRVDVREVRLGDEIDPEEVRLFMADEAGEGFTYDEAVEYLRDGEPSTQFSKFTLPGGENYREILLTLPEQKSPYGKFLDYVGEKYGRGTPRSQWAAEDNATYERLVVQQTAAGDPNFRSTHFDQPNILAHMRVNDRVVDGKKTLFIEEVQSDWHQAGRKKGYQREKDLTPEQIDLKFIQPEIPTGADPSVYPGYYEAFDKNTGQFLGRHSGTLNREQAMRDAVMSANQFQTGVPNAPFKTSWHELTLKRAIQEASEKGYDQIAFTTGKTQAERYSLSKQIDAVKATKQPDGLYSIEAYKDEAALGRGRNPLIEKNNLTAEELEDTIGKELARKIVSDVSGDAFTKTYSGVDLDVGGEGMKGFYDNILPKSLEKLGKKFDAKVGKTEMDGVEVWQMDITPKMRETVTKQGQPLFQIGVGGGAAAGAATMQQPGEQM